MTGRIETLAEGVTPVERWRRFLADQPCLICGGIEGCDHTVTERARAVQAAMRASKPS